LLNERIGLATVARLKDGKEITIWNFSSGRRIYDACPYLITNIQPSVPGVETECLFSSAIHELIDRDSGRIIIRAES
jgi:hypothetical protein